jgi:beta-lactamase class A
MDLAAVSAWDALIFMVLLSDETATAALCRWLGGPAALNRFCLEQGMQTTHHRYCMPETYGPQNPDYLALVTTTTPRDSNRLMHRLMHNFKRDGLAWRILERTRPIVGRALSSGQQILGKGGTSERGVMAVGILTSAGKPVAVLSVFLDQRAPFASREKWEAQEELAMFGREVASLIISKNEASN